jgi:N-acetyl-anhydromuramyl-L-alanine amidase AmpD
VTRDKYAVIAAVISLLLGLTLGITVFDDDGDGKPDRVTVTVEKRSKAPVGDLQIEPEPVSKPGVAETTLRDETPDEVPAEVLESGQDDTSILAEKLNPDPVGGAQTVTCRKDFSGTVYSSRNGQKPTEFILHYTVSPNRPGWGDVLGIRDYFKRTRIASSHYIVDFEGHCLQMVPTTHKSWTQGAANPWAISVEIIATGRETKAEWLRSPLFKRRVLAGLARDNMKRHGIPLKRVNPTGCVFVAGWTDHNALECGNDHTDVTPGFPYVEFSKQLREGGEKERKRRTWARRHKALHKLSRPLTSAERSKNRTYHKLLGRG